jgi:hypothetical protein
MRRPAFSLGIGALIAAGRVAALSLDHLPPRFPGRLRSKRSSADCCYADGGQTRATFAPRHPEFAVGRSYAFVVVVEPPKHGERPPRSIIFSTRSNRSFDASGDIGSVVLSLSSIAIPLEFSVTLISSILSASMSAFIEEAPGHDESRDRRELDPKKIRARLF